MIPSEIRQYYRSGGLRGVAGRVHNFVLNRLRQHTGPRMQPTSYLVRFHEHDVPDQMRIGERYRMHVTVVNQSTRTWTSHDITLSYRWYTDAGNQPILSDEVPRTPLPTIVQPGQATKLQIDVRAPEVPGSYTLALDMLEGRNTWFADIVPGVAQSISVVIEN